jgi:predicted O-methyltransferase YrrM
VNQIISQIHETGSVVGRNGKVHKLHSAIDREEGEFLFSLIKNDSTIKRTLEIGCAYGLSSLYICEALRGRAQASHTIIDPFQNTNWDGAGIANLEAAEIDFFHLIELKSEFALPQLVAGQADQFDFIFIDGWHTFDHTLVDCFYSTRLLRTGGVLAIDDVSFPSVRRVVEFLKNYPCYEQLGTVGYKVSKSWRELLARALGAPIQKSVWAKVLAPPIYRRVFEDFSPRMIALRKLTHDTRNWDWHAEAF